MARAGFWAIGGYRISFRRDGQWYADEEMITNPRIALLFSRHVRADDEGDWVIDLGIDRQRVAVEDTPLVVTSVDGTPDGGFRIRTNDGVEEALDPSTLSIGSDNVLYCRVDRGERGRMRARFLRPAYYALAAHIETDSSGPVLVCRRTRHKIATG